MISRLVLRAMARAIALGWMLSPATVQAGTITSFSTVTIPSDFGTATKLGPQSMQINFSNQFNAARPLNLQLILTGANFVTSTVPNLSLSGSAIPAASAICTVTSFQDKQLIQCTPTGGTTITGVTVSDLTYANATALTAIGGSIKVSGTLSAPSIGTFEEIASKDVVVRTQVGGGTGAVGNTLRQGAVYSSAQASAQSLFRIYNGGGTAGTVTITLADYATGQVLTTWTSPSIGPGAAPQFPIAAIESTATAPFTKPDFYSATIRTPLTGTLQHVLFRPIDGVLTNLSTCDSGVTAPAARLVNVHSSRLGTMGYPSTVVIHNTGTAAATATLAVTDARDGTMLGSIYTTASIPADGELVLPIATIESAAEILPTIDMLHYLIALRGSFTGYLQHRVNNQQAGVVTDMSTVCTIGTTPSPTNPAPAPTTPTDR